MSYDIEESSTQRITFTPNTASYSSYVSVSFWTKLESLPGAHQMHFVGVGSSSSWNPRNFVVYWTPSSGGQVGIAWINSSGPTYSEWTNNSSPATGSWVHWYAEIDWTGSPENPRLWINGSSVSLTNTFGTDTLNPTGTYGQLSLGGEHGSGTTGNSMDGLLAEVAIWSDNIGSSRATALYNGGYGARADSLYPTNLTEYIPLRSDLTNTVGGTGTGVNSPTVSELHPIGISYDNATPGGESTSTSSKTFSHTTGAALSNSIIVVGVQTRNSGGGAFRTVSSVTYNGESLSKADAITGVGSRYLTSEIWYRVGPATGANNVSITLSGSADRVVAGAITLQGVDQSSPIDNTAKNAQDSATAPSVNITTIADNAWVIDSVYNATDTDMTVGTGQTQRYQTTTANNDRAAMSTEGPKTPAGAVTMSWSNADEWVSSLLSLKPYVAATTSVKDIIGFGVIPFAR